MFKKLVDKQKIFIDRWAKENLAGLFVFNIIILLLVLLRFAGYFSPFLEININLIYLNKVPREIGFEKTNNIIYGKLLA